MFDRWRYKMQQFMQGRYGMDKYNQFLGFVVLVLIIIELILDVTVPRASGILWIFSLGLLIYMYFRMFSRNIAKRYNENRRYLEITGKIRRSRFGYQFVNFFRSLGARFQGARRDAQQAKRENEAGYRIFKCPQCGQKIRVPKGKGHIMIRCPKCGNQFEKKT